MHADRKNQKQTIYVLKKYTSKTYYYANIKYDA